MSSDNFNEQTVREAVQAMPAQFRTYDVLDHPAVRAAHGYDDSLPKALGQYLSEKKASFGPRKLDSQTKKGTLWEKIGAARGA